MPLGPLPQSEAEERYLINHFLRLPFYVQGQNFSYIVLTTHLRCIPNFTLRNEGVFRLFTLLILHP